MARTEQNICCCLRGHITIQYARQTGGNSNSFSDIITQPTSHKKHVQTLAHTYVRVCVRRHSRFRFAQPVCACHVRFLSALCAISVSLTPLSFPLLLSLPLSVCRCLRYYQVKCFCGFCRCFVYHTHTRAHLCAARRSAVLCTADIFLCACVLALLLLLLPHVVFVFKLILLCT